MDILLEFVDKLQEEILNENGKAPDTGNVHELCFCIFVISPRKKIEDEKDFYSMIEKRIKIVKGKFPKLNRSWDEYFDTVEHARELAKTFRNIYLNGNINNVIWVGNDRKNYKPADVIVEGKERYLISLKKEKGQMGNFTINKLFSILNVNMQSGENNKNLLYQLSKIDEYSKKINEIAQIWAKGFYFSINNMLRSIIENKFGIEDELSLELSPEKIDKLSPEDKEKYIKLDKLKKELKGNITEKNPTKIKTMGQWISFVKSNSKEVLLKQISEKFMDTDQYNHVWKLVRNDFQNKVLKDFFSKKIRSNLSKLENRLIEVFEAVYGIRDDTSYILLYNPNGGHYEVPPTDEIREIFKNLKIDYGFDVTGVNFKINLYVKRNDVRFLKIIITFRWKNRQMIRNFNTASQVEILPDSLGITRKEMTSEHENKIMQKLFSK